MGECVPFQPQCVVVTGTEIAAAVRHGDTTATSVIEGALAAAESDPNNAFIEIDRQGALDRAEDIDARLAAEDDPGPLAGVPVALKDILHHRGHVTTCGSSFFRYHADTTAPAVARLEAAGAVVVGRTGLHEFAYGFNSENEWFGVIHNPWDRALSPGGSSGGSGVAVGSGIVPIAIGTDTGGSVRVPAALCGAVGLKVTHGRIPTSGVFPLAESLDTVGPITQTVADASLTFEVMAGPAPDDPWSADGVDEVVGDVMLENLKVGVPEQWLTSAPVTPETRNVFSAVLDELANRGVTVVILDSPTLVPAPQGWWLSAAEAASVHRDWFADPAQLYGAEIEERLAASFEVSLDQYIEARRWQSGLVNAARRAFQSVDLLVTPTVGHPRKVIGEATIRVDGADVHHRKVLAAFTATVNQMLCPAIALPLPGTGFPPHSLHLVGPWWSERMLLGVARQLEATGLVGYRPPPTPPR